MAGTRIWLAAIALLLALMAAIEWTAARHETQTYDEATHIAAGYAYWRTGDFHINPEHPPLGKLLPALPLLALNPGLPAEDPTWGGDQRLFGATFLYRNRVDADTMLAAARATSVAVALALGLAIAWWTRRRFGPGASLTALLLYVLDPSVLAHGRYVTNDVMSALFAFLTCAAWGSYLERGGRRRLGLAGCALGLALATKYSAVFLVPVMMVLYGVHRWRGGGRRPRALAVAGLLAAGVVAVVYAPETLTVLRHPGSVPPLTSRIEHGTLFGAALYRTASVLHLPAHSYLVGLESAARHDRIGHPSYLLGQTSQTGGWWYYFPVAFAVKTPLGTLLLLAVALAAGIPRLRHLREADIAWYVLLAPLVVYGALAMHSRLNIGLRHLLPAYPFLFIAIAATVCSLRRRLWLLSPALTLLAAEAVSIYPHHLAFFNRAAGGPARGPEYLLDSNIDWGQDILHLRHWLEARGSPPVCLAYFGTADTARYGVPDTGIPHTKDTAARGKLDCIGAISVTLLHDLYLEPGSYRWLRERRPIGHAGWSIYLYDLRRP